jgi:hypothetical protein
MSDFKIDQQAIYNDKQIGCIVAISYLYKQIMLGFKDKPQHIWANSDKIGEKWDTVSSKINNYYWTSCCVYFDQLKVI